MKKQPREHQIEAIDIIFGQFETANRVTATMACGTGKTLMALWLAERMQVKNIVIAFLRKTFNRECVFKQHYSTE